MTADPGKQEEAQGSIPAIAGDHCRGRPTLTVSRVYPRVRGGSGTGPAVEAGV